MIFEKPDARRALRSIVQAALVAGVFVLAWSLSDRLVTEDGLREALRWAFSISVTIPASSRNGSPRSSTKRVLEY